MIQYSACMDRLGLGKADDLASAERKTSPGGSWAIWAKWVFILAGAYALGLGPAIRIHKAVPVARGVIETVYAPVEVLARYEPAGRFLRWYADCWRLDPN